MALANQTLWPAGNVRWPWANLVLNETGRAQVLGATPTRLHARDAEFSLFSIPRAQPDSNPALNARNVTVLIAASIIGAFTSASDMHSHRQGAPSWASR
jgi:hypothetical protein